jgi:hypothetical protein
MSLVLLRWRFVCIISSSSNSSSRLSGGGVDNVEADRRAIRFGQSCLYCAISVIYELYNVGCSRYC